MVGKKVFLMKPKHQCLLSQLGEWVYGAQSWKERRLLCEFMLVTIGRQILILKNSWKRNFSFETKVWMSFVPMSRTGL